MWKICVLVTVEFGGATSLKEVARIVEKFSVTLNDHKILWPIFTSSTQFQLAQFNTFN